MKNLMRSLLAVMLLTAATSSFAWFGNNGWGNNGWNRYDVWDPRYWMDEMEDAFDDDDDYYYGGPYGYPGYGYGPGYGGYGPGYGGYGPGYGGYGPGYGYGPYGY
jgi:hypothetical protein